MAVVYQHRRDDTGTVFYVGIGKRKSRAYHKTRANKHWTNITRKTTHTVEILEENLTWEEACNREIELIKLYGRSDLGLGLLVNQTDGGSSTRNLTGEALLKIQTAFLGRKHTQKSRQQIAESLTGQKRTELTKQLIREKALGQVTCRNLETGEVLKVTKEVFDSNPNLVGVAAGLTRSPMSEDRKQTQRVKISKPLKCLNDGKEFLNAKEASQYYGVSAIEINKQARGLLNYKLGSRKYPGGLTFVGLHRKDFIENQPKVEIEK